jgi:hypothetical protein
MHHTRSFARAVALGLAVLGVALGSAACKGKDASGGATATASASPAAASAAPGASPPLGSTFEGAITLQTSSPHRPAAEVTLLTKGDKIRLDVTHNGQVAHSILDSEKKQILVLMDAQKMAMTMAVPPPAKQPNPAMPTVTKTGKHETVAGHDCEDWEVAELNGTHTQVCVAEGIGFFDFGAIAPPSAASQFGSWLAELRDKQEFPLRAITTDAGGKEQSRMEVTKIDAHPLDDSTFTLPAGYKLVNMPAGMPGMGGMPPGAMPPGMGGPPAMGGAHPPHGQ